jgi:hypothetical protein
MTKTLKSKKQQKNKTKNKARKEKVRALRLTPERPRMVMPLKATPVNIPRVRAPNFYKKGNICRGSDVVTSLTAITANQYGIIFQMDISPSAFYGTKLAYEARTWEKYRFTKLRITYSPEVSSTQNGAVALAFDSDPTDPNPTEDVPGFRSLMGHEGAVSGQVWTEVTCVMPTGGKDDKSTWYFTGDLGNQVGAVDERFIYQAQFYLMTTIDVSSSDFGTLWVDYEIEFSKPQIAQENLTSSITNTSTLYLTEPTSTGVGSALNALLANNPTALGPSLLMPTQNADGDYRYLLKQGVYEFVQSAILGATPTSSTPLTLNDPYVKAQNVTAPAPIITPIMLSSFANSISDQVARRTKVTIPPGGAELFPYLSWNNSISSTMNLSTLSFAIKRLAIGFGSLY